VETQVNINSSDNCSFFDKALLFAEKIGLKFYPLLFLLTFYLLITREVVISRSLEEYAHFGETGAVWKDYFVYYRSKLFLIIVAFMFAACVVKTLFQVIKHKFKFHTLYIPAIVYAVFAFLSAITSDYRYFAFNGMMDHFETIWVHLGYMVILWYMLLFIDYEKDIKVISYGLGVGTCFGCGYGILQFIGKDPLLIPALYKIALPITSAEGYSADSIILSKGFCYGTFINANYMGMFSAMMFSFFLGVILFSSKMKYKFMAFLPLFFSLATMFLSFSKTSIAALAFLPILILIFYRRTLIRKYYIVIPLLTLMICTFLTVDNYFDGRYSSAIINGFTPHKHEPYKMQDLNVDDPDHLYIKYNGVELYAKGDMLYPTGLTLSLTEASGKEIPLTFDGVTTYVPEDERLEGLVLEYGEFRRSYAIVVKAEGQEYYFIQVKSNNGGYKFINQFGNIDDIRLSESFGFEGYEHCFSSRGYIWSRSIPLLKHTIIKGYGPDCFVFAFPMTDYIWRFRFGGKDSLLTKPHNIYLQIGIQNGVIALIAYLAMFFIVFFNDFKLYFGADKKNMRDVVALSLLFALCSYMIAGITTDSSLVISPVFWIVLGLAGAINNLKKSEKEE